MKEFKAKQEIALFALCKDAKLTAIHSDMIFYLDDMMNEEDYPISINLPSGNWQFLGKLSEIPEDVAKTLVEQEFDTYRNYEDEEEIGSYMCNTATQSLQSIALHLGFNMDDNIYLLKKTKVRLL